LGNFFSRVGFQILSFWFESIFYNIFFFKYFFSVVVVF